VIARAGYANRYAQTNINYNRHKNITFSTFFGNEMKINFIIIAFLLAILGCSENIDEKEIQKEGIEYQKKVDEYNVAVKQAQNNNPGGFLKLYEIVTEGDSAELSVIGRDRLVLLLHDKTELWITIFSKTDLIKFKNYLKAGGAAIIDLPKQFPSEKQFYEEILKKLRKIKGNKKEMELINYISELYGMYIKHIEMEGQKG
jgi:hypothetical protein